VTEPPAAWARGAANAQFGAA